MKRLIFPVMVGALMLTTWVTLAFVDLCLLQNTDPKFDCWSGLKIIAVFASIGAAITTVTAVLARVALHPLLSFRSVFAEALSAVAAALVLTTLFYGVLLLEPDIGGMAGMFFGWLFASFFICGASLVAVKHLAGKF